MRPDWPLASRARSSAKADGPDDSAGTVPLEPLRRGRAAIAFRRADRHLGEIGLRCAAASKPGLRDWPPASGGRWAAALRESALAEWRSNAERFYDYDDREADGEASIDLLKPPVRRVFEHDVRRKPDGNEGVPAAETMTPDEIEQCSDDGIDPWACTDLELSPLWQIQPRPAAVLATIRKSTLF